MQVVSGVVDLGVPFVNAPPPPARRPRRPGLRGEGVLPPAPLPQVPPHLATRWPALVASMQSVCGRVARLPLSAMGRGLAASSYAASKLLYHAEFAHAPTAHMQAVQATAGALVDRRAPSARAARLPGVPARLLHGSPREGGFGLLPVAQHIRARHAHHATVALASWCRHARVDGVPGALWQSVAALLLRHVCPDLHPAQALLSACYATAQQASVGDLGLGALQRHPVPHGPLLHMVVALQALGPLSWAHLAHRGQQAPGQPPQPQPSAHDVVCQPQPWSVLQQALPAMVWSGLRACSALPVRALTLVQMTGYAHERAGRHLAFVCQALQGNHAPARVQCLAAGFLGTLRRVWKVPWENTWKEVLWRLAVDGVPGAGGCGVCLRGPCPCGFALNPAQVRRGDAAALRLHAFWGCPVAQAVVFQLRRVLGDDAGDWVRREHVWLLRPPHRDIALCVWDVACLAALSAMDFGRRFLWACRQDPGALRMASLHAAAKFWFALQDFSDAPMTDAWLQMPAPQPFFRVVAGRRVVLAPPDLLLPT